MAGGYCISCSGRLSVITAQSSPIFTTTFRHENQYFASSLLPTLSLSKTPSSSSSLYIVTHAKRVSSRPGKFDKTGAPTTKSKSMEEFLQVTEEEFSKVVGEEVDVPEWVAKLPTMDEPEFWEGPQWDNLGFFLQYMWAFGFFFALVACGIAVVTYNQGATDFKETPAYKESIKSQQLLEEPDDSSADIFEGNPTEEAPPLAD